MFLKKFAKLSRPRFKGVRVCSLVLLSYRKESSFKSLLFSPSTGNDVDTTFQQSHVVNHTIGERKYPKTKISKTEAK